MIVSCSNTDAPDPLVSKPSMWKKGDRRIVVTTVFEDPVTTQTDTTTVTDGSEIDGYYTVTWMDVIHERVRDGVFEFRYDHTGSEWTSYGKLPTSIGELLAEEEFVRTGPDGTVLGKYVIECRTTTVDTTITVPAGTFRCMASSSIMKSLPDRVRLDESESRRWYAPGIGYIQWEEYLVQTFGGRSAVLQSRTQLKSILQ